MAQQRILVVDDEAAVRGIVAALLERGGYETAVDSGAEQALTRLQQDPGYDLILSDIMMPGIDGLTLLDKICEDYPAIPVVMFSAMQDIQVAMSAFRRGAIDYLLKPFDFAQLLSVVARGIDHGAVRRQNAAYRHNLEDMVQTRTKRLRQTMEDLEESYDITLEAMGDALDLRDAETEGHSRRVTAYSIALARAMGVSAENLRVIARGAFLHDIGKIATPDRILLKPAKLDPDEMRIMREHCARGYELLRKIPFLRDSAEIVYTHQETWEGSGYPRGLEGEEIPLGARIFAIADTLDAITSDRPYRKGAPFVVAREEIAHCAGRQFDPSVVDVFLSIPLEVWSDLRAEIEARSREVRSAILCRPGVA